LLEFATQGPPCFKALFESEFWLLNIISSCKCLIELTRTWFVMQACASLDRLPKFLKAFKEAVITSFAFGKYTKQEKWVGISAFLTMHFWNPPHTCSIPLCWYPHLLP